MLSFETVDLISKSAIVVLFMILVLFGSSFSFFKNFTMFALMLAFLYIMLKNRPEQNKDNIYDEYVKKSSEKESQRTKNFWELGGEYQIRLSSEQSPNFYQTQRYLEKYSQESNFGERQTNNNQYNFFGNSQSDTSGNRRQFMKFQLPPNIGKMVDTIKGMIQPKNYFQAFYKEINQVKKAKQRGNVTSFGAYQDLMIDETYTFRDKDLKFLLQEKDELVIKDPIFAVDIISEFFNGKMERVADNCFQNFRTVSEIVMKCFGMRVDFGVCNESSEAFTKQVTIEEVWNILAGYRRNRAIYQSSRLIIPINDFLENYLDRLFFATRNSLKILENFETPEIMSLGFYVDVLNAEFREENLRLETKLSASANELKKFKNIFFAHKSSRGVFFTYNKLNNFMTKNPLVVILALFMEMAKSGNHMNHEIVGKINKIISLSMN